MTDKVQKIREEVERLKLCTMDEHMKFYSESAEAEYNALCKVEKIIDSLQEEPIFEVGDTIQKKDINSIRYSIINKTSDGYRALRGLSDTIVIWFSEQDQWELVKEPVSKPIDFEKELYKAFGQVKDFTLGMRIAKWFYDMGKNNQESVSEPLEG